MNKFLTNIKSGFAAERELDDTAGFVDEILLMAGVAMAAIAIGSWLGGAAMNKGADLATCIEGASAKAGSVETSQCTGTHGGKDSDTSFQKQGSYTERFGSGK